MVVICPKCKTKLKVADERLAPGGSRFKCPKCGTVLLVKKPVPASAKSAGEMKILVAHSNAEISHGIISLLNKNGYQTITAGDGIETMVKAIKERPFLAIVEVGLPKIYGFEVCKRLKLRPETKNMKFILVSSPYDKDRYRREPVSFYGADDYIEEHLIPELLIGSIDRIRGKEPTGKTEEKTEPPTPPFVPPVKDEVRSEAEPQPLARPQPQPEEKSAPSVDEKVERARRLARTIIADIYLYSTAKADEAIKNDTFRTVFAAEMKEGLKLYDNRIAPEVRAKGDFFEEALANFVEAKKKVL